MLVHRRSKFTLKRLIYSRISVVVLLLLVVFFARAAWNVSQKERETQENLTLAQEKYDELMLREAFLDEEIVRLKTHEGVAEEIRDRYGLAQAGERVIVLTDPSTTTEAAETKNGLWNRIKSWFGIEE